MFQNLKKKIFGATAGCLALAGSAHAAIPAEVTSLSTADVDQIMGYVIVALATMWAYRKVVKTMNRS